MGKAYGSSRIVQPISNKTDNIADYATAIASGEYYTDSDHTYLSSTGAYVLFNLHHNDIPEEFEAAKHLADVGINVELTPEGIVAYATNVFKGEYKYADGKMAGILFEQKTPDNVSNPKGNVVNAIVHAWEKGARIALIYDKYGYLHRGDIADGMAEYATQKAKGQTPFVKAVIVVNSKGEVYEHHF